MKVLVLTSDGTDSILRQTPGRSGRVGELRLTSDVREGPFDLVLVLEDVAQTVEVATRRCVLLPCEPPVMRTYPRAYLAQFSAVCTRQVRPWMVPHHPFDFSLNWHIGWRRELAAGDFPMAPGGQCQLGYDELASPQWTKTLSLSVMSSTKGMLPGHVMRQRFVEALDARFPGQIDAFGNGVRPVADKADALLPYRFHIAIENAVFPGYWTEKLGDAILAGCVPIYHGDPTIARVFPSEAIIPIDLRQPAQARRVIEGILGDPEAQYRKRLPALNEARTRMLDWLNIGPVAERLLRELPAQALVRRTVRPQKHSANTADRIRYLGLRVRRRLARNWTDWTYAAQ